MTKMIQSARIPISLPPLHDSVCQFLDTGLDDDEHGSSQGSVHGPATPLSFDQV
jgi:hypothetical protein